MRFDLFQYPLPGSADLDDLNAFLAGHRVVAVNQHVVTTPVGAQLVFVVQTVDRAVGKPSSGNHLAGARPDGKIDYRAVLSAEHFVVYSRLRDERRRIAERDGVPVYTVFTNAQLAEIVRRGVRTAAEMLAIDGVGEARVERYGARLLALLSDGGGDASSPAAPGGGEALA